MSHPIVRVQIENSIYDRLVSTSVEYAVISFPYTINRMDLRDPISRITNIAKGKISEKLFIHFCHVNDIPVQTKKCQTPYFEPDKRDFILGRDEWDIKNNFIKHDTPVLRSQDYLDLPALIPFRGDWDQWAKKNEYLHRPETESVCFLFSFMKGWDGDTPFLKIDLTDDQQRFIDSLIQDGRVRTDPYEEEWFWKTMTERGSGNPYRYQLNFHPELILCGMAQEKDFPLFSVADHQQYLSGIFKTRIRNMELRIRCLSSFLSLYPRLHHSMVSGSILD